MISAVVLPYAAAVCWMLVSKFLPGGLLFEFVEVSKYIFWAYFILL